jgi:hypothetical protein
LEEHTPVRAVNIEHEDASFGQIEGLEFAARNLLDAAQPTTVEGAVS